MVSRKGRGWGTLGSLDSPGLINFFLLGSGIFALPPSPSRCGLGTYSIGLTTLRRIVGQAGRNEGGSIVPFVC
jgi:hypothetical protein